MDQMGRHGCLKWTHLSITACGLDVSVFELGKLSLKLWDGRWRALGKMGEAEEVWKKETVPRVMVMVSVRLRQRDVFSLLLVSPWCYRSLLAQPTLWKVSPTLWRLQLPSRSHFTSFLSTVRPSRRSLRVLECIWSFSFANDLFSISYATFSCILIWITSSAELCLFQFSGFLKLYIFGECCIRRFTWNKQGEHQNVDSELVWSFSHRAWKMELGVLRRLF